MNNFANHRKYLKIQKQNASKFQVRFFTLEIQVTQDFSINYETIAAEFLENLEETFAGYRQRLVIRRVLTSMSCM